VTRETPEHPSDETTSGPGSRRRTLVLLAIGACAGLIAATAALVAPGGVSSTAAVPDDAVALVNGVAIRRDDYLRLLAGFESDTKGEVDAETRRHILDRMIDEELLVQRALDLGLARVDRRIRANLTSALISSIVGTVEEREPTEAELVDFYEENADFFTRPGRLHVRQVFFRVPTGVVETDALARAAAAREALLAGRSLADVRAEYGDDSISPIPDAPLPALKLREYVGPTALRAALALDSGDVSEPIRSGIGVHVLVMVERTPSETPPLEAVEQQVRTEWRRRAGDRALRAYLDQLREEGEVDVLAELGEG